MLARLQSTSIQLLETVVNHLDNYEGVQKRQRRFAKRDQAEAEREKATDEDEKKKPMIADDEVDDVEDDHSQLEGMQKFKHLSFELIDIGLFFGEKGVTAVQHSKPYQITDKYVHLEERAKQVVENSEKLYRFLNDKVYSPLKNQFYVIFDQANQKISVFINVLKEHQVRVADYIKIHYDNVQVMVQDNWLKLDYNQDGKVSAQDLRQSVKELYSFVVNYNYYLKAHEIKNKLYHEAIKYMQKEVDREEKEHESHADESAPAKEDDDVLSD